MEQQKYFESDHFRPGKEKQLSDELAELIDLERLVHAERGTKRPVNEYTVAVDEGAKELEMVQYYQALKVDLEDLVKYLKKEPLFSVGNFRHPRKTLNAAEIAEQEQLLRAHVEKSFEHILEYHQNGQLSVEDMVKITQKYIRIIEKTISNIKHN